MYGYEYIRMYSSLKNKALKVLGIAVMAVAVSACGGDKSDESESVQEELRNTHLLEAMKVVDIPRVTSIADSLALDVDDLSNNESVAVLLAYLVIHNEASRNDDREQDLVTIRKYVDVYDLSMQRDRDGMLAAMQQAREINPAADFEALYKEFRNRLSEYDALNGQELTTEPSAEEAPADSVAVADSVSSVASGASASDGADLPVEYRPAD